MWLREELNSNYYNSLNTLLKKQLIPAPTLYSFYCYPPYNENTNYTNEKIFLLDYIDFVDDFTWLLGGSEPLSGSALDISKRTVPGQKLDLSVFAGSINGNYSNMSTRSIYCFNGNHRVPFIRTNGTVNLQGSPHNNST